MWFIDSKVIVALLALGVELREEASLFFADRNADDAVLGHIVKHTIDEFLL